MGETKKFDKKTIVRLLSVPLFILAIVAVFYILLNLVLREFKNPSDYMQDILTSSGNKRWQAAFALTKELERRGGKGLEKEEIGQLLTLFEKSFQEDPRLTRYLALVMGQLRDPRAVPLLIRAMQVEDEETVLYALLSLGHLHAKEVVGEIIPLAGHESSSLRQVAVYVLGTLGSDEAVPALVSALEDSVPRVKWNAAVALARMKRSDGVAVIRGVLRGEPPSDYEGLTAAELENLKLNCVKVAGKLGSVLVEDLRLVKEKDPSLKVRNEAAKVLQEMDKDS